MKPFIPEKDYPDFKLFLQRIGVENETWSESASSATGYPHSNHNRYR